MIAHTPDPWLCYSVAFRLVGVPEPEIAYIGVCGAANAATMPDANNNTAFIELIERGQTPIVTWLAVGTHEAMRTMQATLIAASRVRPYCNAEGRDKPPAPNGRARRVRCLDTDATYRTAGAAAAALGVTASAMSQHLAGRTATVRGCRYEWCQ